ncbi:copper amine oxidase N-terminal domain-containing protein [Paenibacillus albidus]|uniref:copper amine oxidase N-terminal domain-containing protein n=1 Tax=Paenibacillus albidus TaxID=2041023 RepID=UPI001BEA3269|nr:copper amine oxidase N-terminal domain-containing protein [Paenibacillus albidus]MBT2293621.1 copper amine oxidase N-terminal domain-containing protein [Paenibacillus albidus]
MRKLKAKAKWFLPFVALLLVLSGCQSVGGLDINKALLDGLDVKSSESNTTFSMNVVPAAGISAEDQEMVELINSFSVSISSLKQQDNGNLSARGTVGYKQMKLPFSFFVDKESLVFTVDGAKQPFYYPIAGVDTLLGTAAFETEKAEAVTKLFSEFVVKNLPNASVINVTPVNEAVYGEQMNLTKLHTEITGDELPGLFKQFLKSISKDNEGFTKLIGGLYDYLYPIFQEEGMGSLDLNEFGFGEIPLDNKEDVVTVLHDAAKLAVDALLLVYDKELNNLYESTPEISTVLSKDTKLQYDVFVDSSLHVRKQNIDLHVVLPEDEYIPIRSISFKSQSEVWNINGPVTADVLNKDNALDVSSIELTPGETLRNFDPNSDIYRLLKNEMGITQKSINIAPDDEYYYPIVEDGNTYVPLRYLAEDLDAKVEWDGTSRSIIVTEDLNGDQLIFKIGSAEATVNGTQVKLSKAIFVDEYGDAYVPVRMFAEALHAEVKKDAEGWIYISRE